MGLFSFGSEYAPRCMTCYEPIQTENIAVDRRPSFIGGEPAWVEFYHMNHRPETSRVMTRSEAKTLDRMVADQRWALHRSGGMSEIQDGILEGAKDLGLSILRALSYVPKHAWAKLKTDYTQAPKN